MVLSEEFGVQRSYSFTYIGVGTCNIALARRSCHDLWPLSKNMCCTQRWMLIVVHGTRHDLLDTAL